MKKLSLLLAIGLAFVAGGCNARASARQSGLTGDTVMPKASWKVSRTFDEKGNLTGYDSTCTWSYTDTTGGTIRSRVGSIARNFRLNVPDSIVALPDQVRKRLLPDTFMGSGFFSSDLLKENGPYFPDMRSVLQEIDILRAEFMNRYYGSRSGKKKE